ncbi:MAG: DNA primase family protein [Desulfocucumaceae bacterium]
MTLESHKQEIIDHLPLEAFYRQELRELKPSSGDNVSALCPFHKDTDPSLSIDLKTGLFNCFGCGASGDTFTFYQKKHNCDFKEALEALGRWAGVAPVKADGEFKSLSLSGLAQAKHLPKDFLQSHAVYERTPDHFYGGASAVCFPYLDEAGRVKAIRLRFGNSGEKKFRWRKGDKTSLYGLQRLPEIRAAGWCLLVEGETDTLTGWLYNLPLLGVPGANNWKSAFAKYLESLKVFIWEEPDHAGAKFVEKASRDLPGLLVIKAPAGIKDISDAHCRGLDVPALIEDLKSKAQPPIPPPLLISGGFSLTDLGNARRLVAQHGQDLRYNHLAKKWIIWTGKYWRVDDSGEVERRAKQVVGNIYQEAAEAPHEQRKGLGAFAIKSEGQNRILAMVRLAQSEPGIPISRAEMDQDAFLFNCQNGTLNLRTGELQPHCRRDLITCLAQVNFDPKAECLEFEKFLWQIFGGNQNLIDFIWNSLGYALTGDCREQCFWVFWGHGANGKGTLMNIIREILGSAGSSTPGYAMHISTETLMARNNPGEIRNDVAQLDGPRFVTASEVDKGRRLSESLVKELTGQDPRRARFLYGENFEFIPQFKLFLATNNKPTIKDQTNAIWRRIKLIKFAQDFKDNPDRELPNRLRNEKSGILNWLAKGCLSWLKEGDLGEPQEVKEATAEYRAEMDELQGFIEDRCFSSAGASAWAADLYDSYKAWAADNLTERETMSQKKFGSALREHGFERYRGAHGRWAWRGLALRSFPVEG